MIGSDFGAWESGILRQDASEIAYDKPSYRDFDLILLDRAFWVAFGSRSEIPLSLRIRRVGFFGLALLFESSHYVYQISRSQISDHKHPPTCGDASPRTGNLTRAREMRMRQRCCSCEMGVVGIRNNDLWER